ncbi:heterokaryon incompatibility protein-domain-containing protein [Nemania serpens]|nr:heterokaryon incompatibility protein-domain-containing protein [Nemania serpens]
MAGEGGSRRLRKSWAILAMLWLEVVEQQQLSRWMRRIGGKYTSELLKRTPTKSDSWTFSPGQYSSPTSVEIFHITLDSSPQYEALSYAWDSKDHAPRVLLDSVRIAISTNWHEALQHLRSTQQKPTLWIDALCTDQNKDKERSEQVNFMRTGSYVLIWLGAKRASSDRALNFLEFLSRLAAEFAFG